MIIEINFSYSYFIVQKQTANNYDVLFKIDTIITNNYLYFIIYSRLNKRAKFNFKYRARSNLPKGKKKEKKRLRDTGANTMARHKKMFEQGQARLVPCLTGTINC